MSSEWRARRFVNNNTTRLIPTDLQRKQSKNSGERVTREKKRELPRRCFSRGKNNSSLINLDRSNDCLAEWTTPKRRKKYSVLVQACFYSCESIQLSGLLTAREARLMGVVNLNFRRLIKIKLWRNSRDTRSTTAISSIDFHYANGITSSAKMLAILVRRPGRFLFYNHLHRAS